MDDKLVEDFLNDIEEDSIDDVIDSDSGIDIDISDLGDIDLSEMDDLDNISLDDLELDDIDFDDVDVTDLAGGAAAPQEAPAEVSLEDIIREAEEAESELSVDEGELPPAEETTDFADVFADAESRVAEDIDEPPVFEEPEAALEEPVPEPAEAEPPVVAEEPEPQVAAAETPAEAPAESAGDDLNVDDLFSSLGIGEEEPLGENYTKGQDELDELFAASMAEGSPELDEIEDIDDVKPKKKKKKKTKVKKEAVEGEAGEAGEKGEKRSIKEILFGAPDEEDLEEEQYLAEKKAKKAEQKEAKKAENEIKKEEKKAEKEQKLELKNKGKAQAAQKKKDQKAAKDAALQAELEAEAATAGKPVPNLVVVIVFALFIALGCVVVLGTKSFNYSQVIKKATDYFERQRYRLAYDEVSGVEVKPKDEELKDRIYTVMYVERLYESYQNNKKLDRYDKALDALLRGIEKYDEHYAEAEELNIVSDINGCRDKIMAALWSDFGMSEEQAYQVISLSGGEYADTIKLYIAKAGYKLEDVEVSE